MLGSLVVEAKKLVKAQKVSNVFDMQQRQRLNTQATDGSWPALRPLVDGKAKKVVRRGSGRKCDDGYP